MRLCFGSAIKSRCFCLKQNHQLKSGSGIAAGELLSLSYDGIHVYFNSHQREVYTSILKFSLIINFRGCDQPHCQKLISGDLAFSSSFPE